MRKIVIAAIRHARAAIAHGNDDATALAIAAFVIAWMGMTLPRHLRSSIARWS